MWCLWLSRNLSLWAVPARLQDPCVGHVLPWIARGFWWWSVISGSNHALALEHANATTHSFLFDVL